MKDLLLNDLTRYKEHWPCARVSEYKRYFEFVQNTPECCERSHLAGHCTGSAFVVSPDKAQVLLLFHPFLQRWLQPGGHADGSFDLLEVAQREAHEETGLKLSQLQPALIGQTERVPLDFDIHPIPQRKLEPAHFHYDLRFLFLADPNLPLTPESSKMKLEWVPTDAVAEKTDEESVLRMVRKVRELAF